MYLIQISDFTPALQPIAELIDCGPLLDLVRLYAGGRLYVPKTMGPTHAISGVIGLELAERLAYYYGGCTIEFPKLATIYRRARNREIVAQRWQGKKWLAAQYQVSARHILRITARAVTTCP